MRRMAHPRPKQPSPSHARRFHWVAALLVGAACSQGVGHDGTQLSQRVVAPETEAPLVSPVEPTVAPGTLEPSELPDEPKTPEDATYPRVPRTGAPGTTKGTISCGTIRCDAATHDCEWDPDEAQWACVPQRTDPSTIGPYFAGCDDTSDCAALERCCIGPYDLHGFKRVCVPRAEAELCAGEICQDGGAACPSGTTCDPANSVFQLNDDNRIEGLCRAPSDRATCADKVRCPAAEPICVIADDPPVCVAENSILLIEMGTLVFRCTRQGDCKAGESCMFGARSQSAFCGTWERGSFNALVCDPGGTVPRLPSEAELKRVCSGDECREKLRCFPRAEFPWLGQLGVAPREADLDLR